MEKKSEGNPAYYSGLRRFVKRSQLKLKKFLGFDEFPNLGSALMELNDVEELKKLFGWKGKPVLNDPQIYGFEDVEDLNERRVRDAEVLGTVMRNANPRVCLEIGTAEGHSTALMAENAPEAKIFTVNILPEEIRTGKAGVLTTISLERDKIGAYYKSRNLTNVTQIFANTADWEPDCGEIDVAFIDGCHDAKFVYNDTRKVLKHMKPGSFVLWHDFHPGLVRTYYWMHDVCVAVERLITEDLIDGRIFHLRDSWIGVYRVK